MFAIAFVAFALMAACGGDDDPSSGEVGALGGACYPNNTCNAGLECFRDLCLGRDSGVTDATDATDATVDDATASDLSSLPDGDDANDLQSPDDAVANSDAPDGMDGDMEAPRCNLGYVLTNEAGKTLGSACAADAECLHGVCLRPEDDGNITNDQFGFCTRGCGCAGDARSEVLPSDPVLECLTPSESPADRHVVIECDSVADCTVHDQRWTACRVPTSGTAVKVCHADKPVVPDPPVERYFAVIVDDTRFFPTHRTDGNPCFTSGVGAHGADIDAVAHLRDDVVLGYWATARLRQNLAGSNCTFAPRYSDASEALGAPDGNLLENYASLGGGAIAGTFEGDGAIFPNDTIIVYEVGAAVNSLDEAYHVYLAEDLDCLDSADRDACQLRITGPDGLMGYAELTPTGF